MKRLKNRIRNRIRNSVKNKVYEWLDDCDPQTISAVISGFLTVVFIGGCSVILLVACIQIGKNNGASGKDSGAQVSAARDSFAKDNAHTARYTRPEIPQMMTDPQQRAFYYVNHYWDGYSLADTAFIRSSDTEQLFSDFLGSLQYVAPEESSAALKNMLSRMEEDSTAYAHFCFLSEKYLYDPNSPMRNEDYYIPVLEQMLASNRLSEYDKLRPADQLEQAHKNRPGMTATDFGYITPTGTSGRMHSLKSDYTLLFFYDPDCSNCREYERVLSEIPDFLEMLDRGALRVLAVYPDENEEEWLLNASKMPRDWLVGWNNQGDIRRKTLYEIRATPTMYLLDKQKTVILKDASLEHIIQYLAGINADNN